jgi:hypothetical protein
MHSERNGSQTEPMRFIQMWIMPAKLGLEPSVQQRSYGDDERRNVLRPVLVPAPGYGGGDAPRDDRAITVHQDAAVYASLLDPQAVVEHRFRPGFGGYFFVVHGEARVDGPDGSGGLVDEGGAAKIGLVESVRVAPKSSSWRRACVTEAERLARWFADRVPSGWFVQEPAVVADREEVLVVGALAHGSGSGGTVAAHGCAREIDRFREESRQARMRIAEEAQATFGRRISWGAACGDTRRVFTNWSAPVMTRLRLPERAVLDTLIAAGVARSRSDALAWCVRLVGANQDEWLRELREALSAVEALRAGGPRLN